MMRKHLIPVVACIALAGPCLAQSGDVRSDRSVHVTQIGNDNQALLVQQARRAQVVLRQHGDGNFIDISQRGRVAHARVNQTGDAHRATVVQSGTGLATLLLSQTGARNETSVLQTTEGVLYNRAVISQTGIGNVLSLVQSGVDNRATLTQQGDGNTMNPVQTGNGNRLVWVQDGRNLPDLGIVQDGGQAIAVMQTGGR